MDVEGGFIPGVYNYCDRWCERCPFTGRCRVFADEAEHEFERDHGPLTEPMAEHTEKHLADARAFVRPGFDEPDEVRKLEAMDLP
jgi:hypothetical protein